MCVLQKQIEAQACVCVSTTPRGVLLCVRAFIHECMCLRASAKRLAKKPLPCYSFRTHAHAYPGSLPPASAAAAHVTTASTTSSATAVARPSRACAPGSVRLARAFIHTLITFIPSSRNDDDDRWILFTERQGAKT